MKKQLWILVAIFVLSGCATQSPLINDKTVKDSRIEISYVLGHNNYKYVAAAVGPNAEISSLRQDQTLEKKLISMDRYQQFAAKVEDLFKQPEIPAAEEDCRTPYKIEIIAKQETRTRLGCRTTDRDGRVGNIIKEGEFLFYSQK